jgi:hypothetical protein
LEAYLQLLIKEFKMSENDESTVMAENTDISLKWRAGDKAQEKIIALALQKIHSLPPVRKKKIFKVRRQLSKDGYNLDKRLDAVLDRFLENLVA